MVILTPKLIPCTEVDRGVNYNKTKDKLFYVVAPSHMGAI